MTGYDYVVVGGGSAGCVMASRLSEDPDCRVLLLEAGGEGRDFFIRMPAGNGFLFGNPKFDWGYYTEPQAELDGRRVYFPRGRALGGSSIMNGMIYIRGNRRDYDGWRQMGLKGWGYADVLPYFRRSEGCAHRDDEFHGRDGPLRTSVSRNYHQIDRAFAAAGRQAGLAENPDFNGPFQCGVGRLDVTVHGGRRQSAAEAYLKGARRRKNLRIETGAMAERVIIEAGRARGLQYRRDGKMHEAGVESEVVVSLGAFASPQLLMLSGIGPADHLRGLGIGVVADLPGVGENLQDHLNAPLKYECVDERLTFARYQRLDRAATLGLRYILTRSGPGAGPFWSVVAFDTVESEDDLPDVQIFLTPMVVEEALDGGPEMTGIGGRLLVQGARAIAGFQIDVSQMRPMARGTVRLASTDPAAPTMIDPRFLTEERERRDLIAGLKRSREIVAQPALDGLRGAELWPGREVTSDASILAAIRATATTGHHPMGTCKMGVDSDWSAVVDQELRVRGVAGLRVVDASVMPTQITGNLNAPIMMIAEKAAAMIRGEAPLPRAEVETAKG